MLDITGGFASAVGFLAVAVFYMYLYGYALVWLMEVQTAPYSSKRVTYCSCFALVVVVLILPSLALILGCFIIDQLPVFKAIILRSSGNWELTAFASFMLDQSQGSISLLQQIRPLKQARIVNAETDDDQST